MCGATSPLGFSTWHAGHGLGAGTSEKILSDFLSHGMRWNDLLGHALNIEVLAPPTWVSAPVLHQGIHLFPFSLRGGLIDHLHIVQIELLHRPPLLCYLISTHLLGLLGLCSLSLLLLLLCCRHCCCCCYLCCFSLLSLLLCLSLLGLLLLPLLPLLHHCLCCQVPLLGSEHLHIRIWGGRVISRHSKEKIKRFFLGEESLQRKKLKFCPGVDTREELGDFTHFSVVLICPRPDEIALL